VRSGEPIGELLGAAGVAEPETRDRDRGLVVVLLEEHPLQNLRALVRVIRDERRAVAEVPEDRVRLRQRPPVVEHDRRHAQSRVQPAEEVRSVRAVDDVHVAPVVWDAEVREEKANLVAIARDRTVVEQHRYPHGGDGGPYFHFG
jgi:hypothetical protein